MHLSILLLTTTNTTNGTHTENACPYFSFASCSSFPFLGYIRTSGHTREGAKKIMLAENLLKLLFDKSNETQLEFPTFEIDSVKGVEAKYQS